MVRTFASTGANGESVDLMATDRRESQDDDRDQHGAVDVFAGDERYDDEGDRQQRQHDEAVLGDREDRLVGFIGDLVLAGLAIDHDRLPTRAR